MEYTFDLYKKQVKGYEDYLERLIRNQITQTTDWKNGGVILIDEGMVPFNTVGFLYAPACCILWKKVSTTNRKEQWILLFLQWTSLKET
jgi:hypothetical protein